MTSCGATDELLCGALTDKYEGVITKVIIDTFNFTGATDGTLYKGICGGLVGEFVPDTKEGSVTQCTVNKLIADTCKVAGGLVGTISKDAPNGERIGFTNNKVSNCQLNTNKEDGVGVICGKYVGTNSNYFITTGIIKENNTRNDKEVTSLFGK